MLKIDSKMQWTEDLIKQAHEQILIIAKEELGMEVGKELFTDQIEIVTAEQMIDAYASIGLPVNYHHWSFGKEFVSNYTKYQNGQQGLAYELIISSDPCIQILMEENSMLEQTMVMSHCIGHNFVFKNNVFFKEWSNSSSIIDYMVFARDYIRFCEDRYGFEEVEKVIDACHAIKSHGVDRYKRKSQSRTSSEEMAQEILSADDRRQKELDIILQRTTFNNETPEISALEAEREENLLYFIMKNSPSLPTWKREIIRIVYKVSQYFYPQSMCQTVHEGMASFCHYYIMTRLEEKGFLTPDAYIAFLKSHSGVIYQPTYKDRGYSGFNPYALGFNIFKDIKRACENPTDEDREWMPAICGMKWQDAIKMAASEFRDDGFILQLMSPKVIREMGMFTINYREGKNPKVVEIQDELGYKNIKNQLAASKQRINFCPEIYVSQADLSGDRELVLQYVPHKGRKIHVADATAVVKHIDYLWGYPVSLQIP
jgi:spore cortex formation protein SpoVR/YcgB (stage V sporulation)